MARQNQTMYRRRPRASKPAPRAHRASWPVLAASALRATHGGRDGSSDIIPTPGPPDPPPIYRG